MRKNRAIRYTHVIHIRVDKQLYDVLKEQYADSIRDALRTAYTSQLHKTDVTIPERIEKEATAEPTEPKQHKTSPLFIDKDTCPYFENKGSPICRAKGIVSMAYECDGSLLKCPKKA